MTRPLLSIALLVALALTSVGCQVDFGKGYRRFHDNLTGRGAEREQEQWEADMERKYSDEQADGSASAPPTARSESK